MKIYCTGCEKDVEPRLTNGEEIYPHRKDLYSLPFWKCDGCKNYVGCHHKTNTPTRPLGCIPTKELKDIRMSIHTIFDPLWKSGVIQRKKLYKALSNRLGREYHTANIKSVDEAKEVLTQLFEIEKSLIK